jgi:hypothetical protein
VEADVPGEVQKPAREGIEAALGAAEAYRLDIKAKQLFLGGTCLCTQGVCQKVSQYGWAYEATDLLVATGDDLCKSKPSA